MRRGRHTLIVSPFHGVSAFLLGDKLGDMIGVLSYDYGNYDVLPAEAPSVVTPSTFQPKITTTLRGTADALRVS